MSLSANSKAVTTAGVGCQVDAIKYDEKKFTAVIYIIRLSIVSRHHFSMMNKMLKIAKF